MILIGLFGGSHESRDAIAQQLAKTDPANIGVYTLNPASSAIELRAERLEVVLHGLSVSVKASTLIVTHVLSEEEADLIRSRGGHLWYVMGSPSNLIPIRRDDVPVTHQSGGHRHYLDAQEAYSEVLLRHGRVR